MIRSTDKKLFTIHAKWFKICLIRFCFPISSQDPIFFSCLFFFKKLPDVEDMVIDDLVQHLVVLDIFVDKADTVLSQVDPVVVQVVHSVVLDMVQDFDQVVDMVIVHVMHFAKN